MASDADTTPYGGLNPSDRDAMIRTVLTEARANDPLGWASVASVIKNRLQAGGYGSSPAAIVQAPNQFEVWGNGRAQAVDPNSPQYEQAGRVVDAVASGMPDPTGGMTHFYSPSGQAALGRAAPSWGRSGGLAIGGNLFYAPNGAVAQSAPAAAAIDNATAPAATSQGKSMAEDPLSVLKRYGVSVGTTAPQQTLSSQPGVVFAQPTPAAQPAAADPMAVLARYGVRAGGAQPAAPTAQDGAPSDVKNVPTAPDDPIYHGAVPVGEAPDMGATTAFASGVQGAPIVGPYVSKAVQNAAAAARAIANNTKYSDEQRNVQEMTDLARAQHPVAATAGDISGGVLATAPAVAVAPTAFGISKAPLLARMAVGGGTNALVGGTDAAVRGNDLLLGAGVGGFAGIAAPAVGATLGSGARFVGDSFNGGVDGVGRPAVNLLTQALGADTPAFVQANANRLGPQAVLPDLGPSFGGLAQGLAVKPGDAKSAIFSALEQRAGGANQRISTDLTQLLGPATDPQAITDNLTAARAATDRANYGAVHGQGVDVDPSSVVQTIDARLPTSTGAQRTALQNLRRELVIQDAVPATDTAPAQPARYATNSELLHNLRQEIDDAMDQGAPGLGVPAGALNRAQSTLGAVRNSLDNALKTQVPGMSDADAASADFARRIAAIQDGTNILASGKTAQTPESFARQFASMSPQEQDALRQGARGEIERLVGTASNDPAKLRAMLQGEGGWNTSKLATVFGEQPTSDLVNAVGREGAFGDTMNRVTGNSQTAARTAAANLLRDTDPAQINLMPANWTGLALQGAKKALYDPLYNALMTPNNGPRDAQLARVLSLQGPQRDAVVNQLLDSARTGARVGQVSDATNGLGTFATNQLLQNYLRQREVAASSR